MEGEDEERASSGGGVVAEGCAGERDPVSPLIEGQKSPVSLNVFDKFKFITTDRKTHRREKMRDELYNDYGTYKKS